MQRVEVWRVVVVAVFVVAAVVFQGCAGPAQSVGDGSGPAGSTSLQSGDSCVTTGAQENQESPSFSTDDWVAPDATVVAAFQELRSRLGSRRLFVPGRLPAAATLAGEQCAGEWLASPAAGEIRVVVPGVGVLQFLEGIEGDVGDLPHREVGSVGGCTASAYHILGGTLVQWGCDGVWYGVYGRGFPQDVVIQVALGMS